MNDQVELDLFGELTSETIHSLLHKESPELQKLMATKVKCWDVNEYIIKDRIEKYKGTPTEKAIHNSFKYMSAVSIYKLNPKLYKAHCNEIVDRVIEGFTSKEMELGTNAECLIVCMNTSIKAPLNPVGQTAYEILFKDTLEDLPEGVYTGTDFTYRDQYYHDEARSQINKLREKIAKSRKLDVCN